MAKKGQLLRKELSEKTRKAMEFNIFKQGLKESSAVDASLSPAQVADQLKKSLATSKELHTAMESLVENRKKVSLTNHVSDLLSYALVDGQY